MFVPSSTVLLPPTFSLLTNLVKVTSFILTIKSLESVYTRTIGSSVPL